jgi:hypothetical protein
MQREPMLRTARGGVAEPRPEQVRPETASETAASETTQP